MACLNIMEITPNLLVPLDSDLETFRFGARVKEKNSTSCVITASVPTYDHALIRFCKCKVHSGYANGRIMLCTAAE